MKRIVQAALATLVSFTWCVVILEPFVCFSQALDKVSKSVVFLSHDYVETFSDKRGTFEVWLKQAGTNFFSPKLSSKAGTGFFMGRGGRLYLVTAKHVAVELGFTESDTVTTGLENGMAARIPLSLFRGTNAAGWLHHDKADVSVLPLAPALQVWQFLGDHFLDAYSFIRSTTNCPSRELTLTVVGFPLGLGIGWGREPGESFAPLTRKTRASSGFLEGATFFLLEDPSVEGYSGAPVFDLGDPIMSPGGLFQGGRVTGCYGIISHTRGDNTGGKMAGVVPSKFILELVEKYETRH